METVAAWIASKVVAIAANAGIHSLAAAQVIYTVAYYGSQVAITAAVAAGAQALQSTPDPETAKGSLKQAIPPRIRGYGRRRIGGSYMCWEAKDNYAYDVVAVHSGRIEAIEEVWSHDAKLVVRPDGWVEGGHGYGAGNNDLIHLEWRLGLPTETAYPAIVAALGGAGVWTEGHRGDHIASLGVDYHHAKKENLLADFPNGDPQWSVTARLSRIWDPRIEAQERENPDKPGAVHTASGNLALQILDFCCRLDGMAMDYETEIAPVIEHWMGEADICDEAIPLKGGGTEPRYWGSGYYALPDEPQNTLDKMLAACDGRLLKDEFGLWRLWVGKQRAPTVHLTDEDIADYDIQGDAAAFDAVNEIVPSFVSEAEKWTMVEAKPWTNAADVALRGRVLSQPLPLEWVNSRPLARRLAKRESIRQLADIRGVLVGKLSCVRAMGHRWISVDLSDLGLEAVTIEVLKGARTAFSRASVEIPFVLADPAADEWDAETEEDSTGTPAPSPPAEDPDPPTITSVAPFFENLGGAEGVRLHIVGAGPDRSDLTWYVRWLTTGSTSWTMGEVTDETAGTGFSGDSGFVPADVSLDVQLGFQTATGSIIWSATTTLTASTEGLPPPPPTGLSAVADGSDIVIQVSAPNSTRLDHIRFRMGDPGDDFAAAIDIGTEAAAPGQLVQHIQELVGPGDYLIWATAETAADLASAPAGPVGVTV